jgi:hypothetical protein
MSAYIFASVEITDPAAYEEYRQRAGDHLSIWRALPRAWWRRRPPARQYAGEAACDCRVSRHSATQGVLQLGGVPSVTGDSSTCGEVESARHRRRVSASPLRLSLALPTVRGRSCRCLATQADGRGLSARVRRSCQVCVRAVYLLRAGATRCSVLNEPFAHADYLKTDSKDARRQS